MRAAVFNVGDRRRRTLDDENEACATRKQHDAAFFDPANTENSRIRDRLALDTLDALLDWLVPVRSRTGSLVQTPSPGQSSPSVRLLSRLSAPASRS